MVKIKFYDTISLYARGAKSPAGGPFLARRRCLVVYGALPKN